MPVAWAGESCVTVTPTPEQRDHVYGAAYKVAYDQGHDITPTLKGDQVCFPYDVGLTAEALAAQIAAQQQRDAAVASDTSEAAMIEAFKKAGFTDAQAAKAAGR